MLMNLMAAGCFVVVAAATVAMLRFDARSQKQGEHKKTDTAKRK